MLLISQDNSQLMSRGIHTSKEFLESDQVVVTRESHRTDRKGLCTTLNQITATTAV